MQPHRSSAISAPGGGLVSQATPGVACETRGGYGITNHPSTGMQINGIYTPYNVALQTILHEQEQKV